MNDHYTFLVQGERRKIQEKLKLAPEGRRLRCITVVARSLLLQGSQYKAKSIGAGVYEVWVS